ncbi:unnamed protein product, partial [Cylicostephanus goldi]
MLINSESDEGNGDTVTESKAKESLTIESSDSVVPDVTPSESSAVSDSNNTTEEIKNEEESVERGDGDKAERDDGDKAEEKNGVEENTPLLIKSKQKKIPINAEKKPGGGTEDGVIDDEDSEDDSDFNEAEEEAEDEECEDEDECDSDDDTEDVGCIPGGLETPGEDSGTTACVCLM